jgi:hypothetical protein
MSQQISAQDMQPRNRSARVIANENKSEQKLLDTIKRHATIAAKNGADAYLDDANNEALAHIKMVDEGLRIKDLRSFGVETVHRQTHSSRSPSFDNSLLQSFRNDFGGRDYKGVGVEQSTSQRRSP